jgi:hypothetical protein
VTEPSGGAGERPRKVPDLEAARRSGRADADPAAPADPRLSRVLRVAVGTAVIAGTALGAAVITDGERHAAWVVAASVAVAALLVLLAVEASPWETGGGGRSAFGGDRRHGRAGARRL